MSKIKFINRTYFRNGAHFTFMEAFLGLMKTEKFHQHEDAHIADAYAEMAETFEREAELYRIIQGSEYTKELADADSRRDRAWGGFGNTTRGLAAIGTTEQKEAAQKVLAVIKLHKVDVNKTIDLESADMTVFIREAEKLTSELNTLGIASGLAEMKSANEDVKRILQSRNKEISEADTTKLKEVRSVIDAQYDALVEYINSLNVVTPDAKLESFIKQWNVNIARVDDQDVTKTAKKEENTPESADEQTEPKE